MCIEQLIKIILVFDIDLQQVFDIKYLPPQIYCSAMQLHEFRRNNEAIQFALKNSKQLLIQVFSINQPSIKFQTTVTKETLHQSLKARYHSVQDFFADLGFEYYQQNFSILKNDVQAKILIEIPNNQKWEIILRPAQKQENVLQKQDQPPQNPLEKPQNPLEPPRNPLELPQKQKDPHQKQIESPRKQIKEPLKQQKLHPHPMQQKIPQKKIEEPHKQVKAPPKIVVLGKKQQNIELRELSLKQKQLDKEIQQLQKTLKSKATERAQNAKRSVEVEQERILMESKLLLVSKKLSETRKKYLQNPIQNSRQYTKYIEQQNGKKRLFMRKMEVTDLMIQDLITFDLSRIQILSLGDNQITDIGFTLLFQQNEWPILSEIFIQNNQIQNIHSLNNLDCIQTLVIHQNPLSQASCKFICQNCWPSIKMMRLSFKQGLNTKCWRKMVENLQEKFMSLQQLHYSKKPDLSQEVIQQITSYCNKNGIALNHGVNKEELQKIIQLQMLQDFL